MTRTTANAGAPGVTREFVGLTSATARRAGAGGHPCQGLYHRGVGRKPKVAIIATHYQIDFSEHYLADYIATRGIGFLGWNTRYRGFESSFLLDHALVDIGVGVRWLREVQGVEGFYAPFAVVLDHLRSLYRDNADTSTFWQRLLDVPALAVDECSRFKATDFAREKLFVLADTRYRRRHSHLTLFATNDDPRQHLAPEDAIGYLFSRMREGTLIELRGDVREAVR